MRNFVERIGAAAFFMADVVVFVSLATLFGGFTGWIVGIWFGDTILGIAAQLGVKNVTMFQLGAFLGFIGGFLRTKVRATVEEK
jgi:hypothetical protein